MRRAFLALSTLLIVSAQAFAAPPPAPECGGAGSRDDTEQLGHFDVIELRRYPIASGQRPTFAKYYDDWFPAAFEQLGVLVFGEFFERGQYNFTWIRGFHTIEDHAIAQAQFYYGPIWREHKSLANSLLPGVDDNVLQLHALNPQTEVPAMPAVDPVKEPRGAQGIVVAEIYAVRKGDIQPFSERALKEFSRYQVAGVRAAGVLVTLDAPNNFPQLPVKTDGPYLVALHILRDESVLEDTFDPLLARTKQELTASGMLQRAPEILVLHTEHNSRLRWLPACE